MNIAEDVEFEVWDAEFLDQVIQVEELARSTASQNPNPNPNYPSFIFPPAPPQPPPPPEPPRSMSVSHHIPVSYSPPRELSQRVADLGSFSTRPSVSFSKYAPSSSSSSPTLAPGFQSFDIEKDIEIDRLKRELGRVSKQLTVLEQERVELRKKGDKGEEDHKVAFLKKDGKFTEGHLKSTKQRKLVNGGEDSEHKCEVIISNHYESQQLLQKMPSKEQISACNDIGIQTDIAHDSVEAASHDHLLANHDLSKKLLDIWVSPNEKQFGQNLVSKLLTSCETDFIVLFGCMSMKLSSQNTVDSFAHENSSDKAWKFYMRSLHGSEAVEVSRLYSILAKVSSGMAKMDALFAPLLDLCILDNVVIAHKSLHVLHVLLKHLSSFERKSERSALCSGKMSWLSEFTPRTTLRNLLKV